MKMREVLTNAKRKVSNVVSKLEEKAFRIKTYATYIALTYVSTPMVSYASGTDPDAAWNSVMDFLLKWIPRLGGVLMFIGAIEFAIAYKNEDANSKTNATRLLAAGAMVIAIPTALASLLKV